MWRSNKYYAQYPWVLRWSLEKKRVNLCVARGHFGAIVSMKIENGIFDIQSEIAILTARCRGSGIVSRDCGDYLRVLVGNINHFTSVSLKFTCFNLYHKLCCLLNFPLPRGLVSKH